MAVQTLQIRAANKTPRVISVTAGGTATLVASDTNVVLFNAATLATLTVALPAASTIMPGKELNIGFGNGVTTVTWSAGAGNTVLRALPTTMAAATSIRLVLDGSYRWCIC